MTLHERRYTMTLIVHGDPDDGMPNDADELALAVKDALPVEWIDPEGGDTWWVEEFVGVASTPPVPVVRKSWHRPLLQIEVNYPEGDSPPTNESLVEVLRHALVRYYLDSEAEGANRWRIRALEQVSR